MPTRLNPYISFKGNAREAMEFYHSVLGGKLDLNTFGESGMPVEANETDMIMHAMITTDSGMALMGADTPSHMEYHAPAGISISLSGDDEAELRGYFEKLSEGGTIAEEFKKATWGDTFGMFTDKFGIFWMVNASNPEAVSEQATA